MSTVVWLLQAVLGIGFLVFIHETGHFLAARWCGVRIHVFSLGFGPRLLGFERRGCDYRISLVPVGGYVRMEGELGEGESVLDASGSLSHKSPLQRIFVYSAGVLMNFLVALVLFPIVYFWGVPTLRPIVGAVEPGSPAWSAGIAPGSIVRSVNGISIDAFEQLSIEVALAKSPMRVEVEEPVPGEPGVYRGRAFVVNSQYDPKIALPRLGVEPPPKLQIVTLGSEKRVGVEVQVAEGSPAHTMGVRSGDLLIGIDGRPLDYGALAAWHDLAGERIADAAKVPLQFHAVDPMGRSAELLESLERGVELAPRPVPGSERPMLGLRALGNVVKAVRDGEAIRKLGLKPGDQILEVNGHPYRRPTDLSAALAVTPRIELRVRRAGRTELLTVDVPAPETSLFASSIAFEEGSARVLVTPGYPASEAGLRDGDLIRKIESMEIREFRDIQRAVTQFRDRPLGIEVERESAEGRSVHTFTAKPKNQPLLSIGIEIRDDTSIVRAESLGDAIRLGVGASLRFVKQIAYFLKKIALGDVPAKEHLGGPISIATQTYQVAQTGFVQLLRFLGILSLNLALINLLPIPVLDGGNLLFVLVEAVKGSPVSDRVLGASQMVGVFLLIALMVWVTFHDVRRNFGVFF